MQENLVDRIRKLELTVADQLKSIPVLQDQTSLGQGLDGQVVQDKNRGGGPGLKG